MTYLISYFIINIIFAGMMIYNVYYVNRNTSEQQDLKKELEPFLPITLLFGAIILLMFYYYNTVDGE